MTHHRLYLNRFYLRNNSQKRESLVCKIVDLAQEAAQQTDIKFFTPSQLHSRTKQELRIRGTPQFKRTMSSSKKNLIPKKKFF